MRATIQHIADKMNRENEPWLLAGKTAAVFQGVMIHSKTLEILTTAKGANRFAEIFQNEAMQKVKYREIGSFTGIAGVFSIHDIETTLIGEPQILCEHRKIIIPVENIFMNAEKVEIGVQVVPLLPVAWNLIHAILQDENSFIQAIKDSETEFRSDFSAILQSTGLNFYLKTKLEQHFPKMVK